MVIFTSEFYIFLQDIYCFPRILHNNKKVEWGALSVMSLKKVAFLLITTLLLNLTVVFANPAEQPEYQLSKYDVLNIVIVGVELGLNDIMIGPDGYVNLPYAGSVKLAGLTVPAATKILSERLGEYMKIPSMSLIIKQYGPRKVYVMGEVKNPGMYSLSSDYMNVFAALSSAGGIAKKGRTKQIAVVRVNNDKVNVQKVDIERFIKNQDITQNIALKDGDMIYVPKSNKIDLNEDVMPILTGIGLFKSLSD